ncbi:MAG: PilZ domain-containing protein [Deltaproteobacteria bacterium]|nr:PilZ domain-containing protein [Deltaproteobacteria bacterium]
MAFHLKRRRKAPRAPLNRAVQFKMGSEELSGRGIEVGVGGMSIWAERVPDKGSMVTLRFSLPGSARQVTAMAEVVWSRSPAGGKRNGSMGVKFIALPRDERNEIRSFVTRMARQYRDLHILLAMNEWKMERLKELTEAAHLSSYRDIKELKEKIKKAMDGFRL